jgi:signal transduction histidine kinase
MTYLNTTDTILPMPPSDIKNDSEKLNVLLIEDNQGDARYVQILLSDTDWFECQVVNKISLAEGLAALDEHAYDVVLLDLTLPDSRGFETLEKFMQYRPNENVIVMTGISDKLMGLKAVQAGAQDYLIKGNFDSDMLAKTLRYTVERKNVLGNLAAATRGQQVAEESARLKEQFIANISHEMRTPMNAINGMSNLLSSTNLNEEQREYIHSIKQSSEVLLGVINDILEISTIQNGKVDFDYRDFDLHELLNNVVSVMQYKKEEKNLHFDLQIQPEVPRFVCADKLRLNQILFNIVGNAVKFTDGGRVEIGIAYLPNAAEPTKFSLRFSVKDTGIGIPEDKIPLIFEAFTRIRTKDRIFEGTGLGLAIVRNLVMLQGGKIGATSIVGVGTTVSFELPMTLPKTHFTSEEISENLNPSFKGDSSRAFRLLLIEDHKMNQIVARKTLEKQFANIRISIAENGREGINLLEKGEAFDIILCDIQMPVMDGNETVAYIRERLPHIKTPVLAMTAHAYISKDGIFKQYGFDDFVLKPFDPQQLFGKIYEHLK